MKVLVSDAISQQGLDILSKAGLSVDVKTKLTPAQLIEEIAHYDGLIIRSATKVTQAVLSAAKNLKVVGGPDRAWTTWIFPQPPHVASS